MLYDLFNHAEPNNHDDGAVLDRRVWYWFKTPDGGSFLFLKQQLHVGPKTEANTP